jgi:hypothetical protein
MTRPLRPLLEGGDRRSTGGADEAARSAAVDPAAAEELWNLLEDCDPIIRMRAADALEKASRTRPDLLLPNKQALLGARYEDGTAEVRWHLFAMCARLPLDAREAKDLLARLDGALRGDGSRIVKVMALQAAWDISVGRPEAKQVVRAMLDFALTSPWPSVAARARKLT